MAVRGGRRGLDGRRQAASSSRRGQGSTAPRPWTPWPQTPASSLQDREERVSAMSRPVQAAIRQRWLPLGPGLGLGAQATLPECGQASPSAHRPLSPWWVSPVRARRSRSPARSRGVCQRPHVRPRPLRANGMRRWASLCPPTAKAPPASPDPSPGSGPARQAPGPSPPGADMRMEATPGRAGRPGPDCQVVSPGLLLGPQPFLGRILGRKGCFCGLQNSRWPGKAREGGSCGDAEDLVGRWGLRKCFPAHSSHHCAPQWPQGWEPLSQLHADPSWEGQHGVTTWSVLLAL